MCRIYGYFQAHVAPHELRAVSSLQRHGGPDGQSSVRGDGWAIGNNRLAVMDPDGGDQPYTELDGKIRVVFNGEIYNHHVLREQLRAKGYRFTDTCDGSVLAALYLEYGAAFAERLDGMYAVAVIDLRDEPSLTLATDDIGMKPLYYHWDPLRGQFYFASEIPALLSFPAVDPEPWLPGLDAYLTTKIPFGEQTAFENIKVLPAATTAVLNRRNGLRIHRRAAASTAPGGISPSEISLEEAAETVRDVLRQEVRRLLLADVPVCAVTSGGLDSSFVTALAAEVRPDLHTFNIAYHGDWPADERAFAREVAQRCGTVYRQVLVDPKTFPDLLPDVVWHLGQPNSDPITLSTYALFEQVRAAGFKVALTGDAADELFGGYDRIKAALAVRPGGDWVSGYVDALSAVSADLRQSLYTPEYLHYVRSCGDTADRIAERLRAARGPRLQTLTDFEIGHRLPAYHLRRVDHLSMAHAVEVRLPFCQPSVVRLARSLAPEHKVLHNQVKRVLYGAAGSYLPRSVLDRPKQPFTLPVTAMLRDGEPLMDYAREVLSPANLRRAGLLDGAAVQRLLAQQATRPADRTATAVWALLVYNLWVNQFDVADRSGYLTWPAAAVAA